MPSASDACQETPNTIAIINIAAEVITTCKPPKPRIEFLILHNNDGSSSSPITNSIITTPNSAKCIMSCPSSPINPSTAGPIITPAIKYPSTEPSPILFAIGTETTAAVR